jgi:hypothetical protein
MTIATFRPHAIIVPERRIPNPIFVAALIGVENILRLDFDASLPEHTYLDQAMKKLPKQTIAIGKPIGLTINYAADRAVRFDLEGKRIERVFDPIENSRLTKFRTSKADNSVHAGIRDSDLDIGREDLD